MNVFTYIHRSSARLFAFLAVFSLLAGMVPGAAFATVITSPYGSEPVRQVEICHNNNGNGFVVNTVSVTSSGAPQGGHDATNGAHAPDIIPPYYYFDADDAVKFYNGKNWNPTNEAIWTNDCSAPVVVDVCPNIPDAQATIPQGYQIVDGQCVVIPTDVCPNIEGNQATIPQGMVKNEAGQCVTPVDVCPNIPDAQATIPSGMIKNDAGECVQPPVDVCPNLENLQTTVPTGYELVDGQCMPVSVDVCPNIPDVQLTVPTGLIVNDAGECVQPPVDVCPNIEGAQATVPQGKEIVDGQCVDIANVVPGCTDKAATNYNRLANTDDKSCEYNYVSQCVPVGETPVVNLLQNGSFETPVVTANGGTWEIFTTVANWTIGLSDGLELWKGLGIGASEGLQNAELDGNDATKITQLATTIPGATYELRFDFAARTADKADNNVNALVDGAIVKNANSANTNWTTYGKTFVAVNASTEIGFEDIGTAQDNGGTGSLIDNAVLCLVSKPAPVEACELTVVSDASTMVNESGALVVSSFPGTWVGGIAESVAQWIWSAAPGSAIDPAINQTETFVKTFNWNGPVTAATLQITSDNTYSVKLNGVVVGSDATPTNFMSVDTIVDIADNVIQGTNTLEIEVTNLANGATVLEGNPAGLIYDLNIVGNTSDNCKVVPDDGGGDDEDKLSCVLTVDDSSIRRGSNVVLSWTTLGKLASATLTGEGTEDIETITLPNGSFEVENLGSDAIYTMTVYGDYLDDSAEEIRESATCTVSVETSTGGGGGGRRTPDGDVAGDSTSKPEGQVLGEATSTLPVGAPNTGAGGTSHSGAALPTMFAILTAGASVRKTK